MPNLLSGAGAIVDVAAALVNGDGSLKREVRNTETIKQGKKAYRDHVVLTARCCCGWW